MRVLVTIVVLPVRLRRAPPFAGAREPEQDLVEAHRAAVGAVHLLQVGAVEGLVDVGVARHQAAVGVEPELLGQGATGRQRQLRHLVHAPVTHREDHVAHPGDGERVGDGARELALGERLRHLVRGFHVELVAREAEPARIGEHRLGLDRQQRLVSAGVLLADVVSVVGRHHPEAVAVGEVAQDRVQPALFLQPVVLELDEEVVPEDVQVLPQHALAGPLALVEDGARDLRAEAARQGHDPVVVLPEQLVIDARLHVEALEVGAAGEPAQVLVSREVLRQQRQVEVAAVQRARNAALLEARAAGDVRLEPEDGLDALGHRRLVELHGAVHVAVVRHGQRRLVRRHLLHPGHQVLDARCPVEQAIRGVLMQMRELHGTRGHASPYRLARGVRGAARATRGRPGRRPLAAHEAAAIRPRPAVVAGAAAAFPRLGRQGRERVHDAKARFPPR